MSKILEHLYIERLESSSVLVQKYITEIYSNEQFLNFINKQKNGLKDSSSRADILRNETVLFILKIHTIDEFLDSMVVLLDLQPHEIESATTAFFNTCIPPEIQDSIDPDYKEPIKEPTHISHVDVLSEIENPTPSISTTTDFQNQSNQISAQATQSSHLANISKTSTSINSTANSTPTNPSLHSSDPSVIPYTNPALHIASKLDQNLGTPSASVPKDIYVSKKPDPYHEPVEI